MSVTPQEKMLELIGGFWLARSVDLAAQLGLVDDFDEAPKPISELAIATATDPKSLYPYFSKNRLVT